MGKPTGFMEIPRQDRRYAPVADRILHSNEFVIPLSEDEVSRQGARCMDCGIPYCHSGCPVNNIIPDWNDLVYQGRWQEALQVLHSTNNFPEFTGRICPAPCEASCTLNLEDQPVTIKTIECSIIDKGWDKGWIKPVIARHCSGKRVAIIGSGPAGLAAAQQLARAGHHVAVYERQNRIGGLLRYGIPDYKLDKNIIDRRIAQMNAEGVEFHTNSYVGVNLPVKELVEKYDAVVLAGGAEKPRDLPVEGRELSGVEFAMDFLRQQNMRLAGDHIPENMALSAEGKHVIVIGGGDTGSDCIGTSIRQKAATITQLEILPKPPEKENKGLTWPDWPNKLRTSSSQEEGCERYWSVSTKKIVGDNGQVKAVHIVDVAWQKDDQGQWRMSEVAGSEKILKADLVLLAMGFVHPLYEGMLEALNIELDERGNVNANTDNYQTSIAKVFSAGDMRRGQSLVVWAIREGRQAAYAVDEFLMGYSNLPR